MYRGTESIFAAYGVQEQLNKDFARKVWLPGGGYIVIDHTEALTVVDVNTGKYTGAGGDSLEETVTETNIQAAVEIARLMRLRDIGGMIIVDFIDMEEASNRHEVAATLEGELKKDRTKAFVMGWTKLGLLELTRKKVREESTLPMWSRVPAVEREKIYFAFALIFDILRDKIFKYVFSLMVLHML